MNLRVPDDRETDSLLIPLPLSPIQESDEVRPGVIADVVADRT